MRAENRVTVPSAFAAGQPPWIDLAQEAFVYGFPLVFNLRQVQRYVSTNLDWITDLSTKLMTQ